MKYSGTYFKYEYCSIPSVPKDGLQIVTVNNDWSLKFGMIEKSS